MAHVRKDAYTAAPDWWRHLRKFNKRKTNQAERRAAKKRINKEVKEALEEDLRASN